MPSLGSRHRSCTPPLYGRAPPLERPCPQQVHKIESRLPGQHIGELGLGLGPRGFECRRAVVQEPRTPLGCCCSPTTSRLVQRRVGADEAGLDERVEPGQEHRDGAVRNAQAPAQRQQQELEHVMSTSLLRNNHAA